MKSNIINMLVDSISDELDELKKELSKEYPKMELELEDWEGPLKFKTEENKDFKDLIYFEYENIPFRQTPFELTKEGKQYLIKDGDEIKVIKKKKKTVWDLAKGDHYFHLYSNGEIAERIYLDCRLETTARELGSLFLTHKDAKKEREKRKAITRVNRSIDELNDGWTPDWDNTKEDKFVIIYSNHYQKLEVALKNGIQYPTALKPVELEAVAYHIVEQHEDDLKLIFEVEE